MKKRRPAGQVQKRSKSDRIDAADHASIQGARTRVIAIRKRFAVEHVRGQAALDRHDYATLGEVIRREHELIQEHLRLIQEARDLINRHLTRHGLPRLPRQ